MAGTQNDMNRSKPDPIEKSMGRSACIDDSLHTAERGLAAFTAAINELFGPEEARVSADEWIEELLSSDQPIGPGIPDWRRITIMASSRLASRVCRNAESAKAVKASIHRRTPRKST